MQSSDIFTCYTLIDITNTGVIRDSVDAHLHKLRNQQRNWETLLQVLSLRAQPIILDNPVCLESKELQDYSFGKEYLNGNVWTCKFTCEHVGAYDVSLLEKDVNHVPVVSGLNETITLHTPVFLSDGPLKNIYFKKQ